MPPLAPSSLETFSDIAFQCLHNSRERRPTGSFLVKKLEIALEFQEHPHKQLTDVVGTYLKDTHVNELSKDKGLRSGLQSSTILEPRIVDSGREDLELTLMELIEVFSKKGTKDLNLQNKLKDQIEWLPDSVGKLSSLSTLDLSENRLIALPSTISGLSSLTKLDLHANKIIELPKIFWLSSQFGVS
ncbi:putative leucine-rich repeat domain superfamily [Helianthus annuus]|uniref:Leucine-rich repeat domain superfamily n=1 Tax=Helianthus annuus TaxID=4232 RepID=A0A9K3HYW8_HELAN|nr:putative leucine-rich repeat domain superfamily [Helianthus annuus]KAJ0879966.1 putative leucine-rich repeat domain superfamily [Helianthus annuus]